MASDLHPAIWRGPFAAELPDMSVVYPGEQHQVTSEDLKSDHWEAVGGKPKAKSAGKGTTRKRKPKSSDSTTPEPAGETDPGAPDPGAGETPAEPDGSAA